MQVGEQVIKEVLTKFEGLMRANLSDLDKGYINAGSEAFNISFGSKLSPMKNEDGIDVEASISFTVEKVKDTAKGSCSRQMRIEEATSKDMGNRKKPYLHRLDPRHLIDIRKMTCLKGCGPHCTMRYPCFACPAEQ